ncbi:hypothetical protein FSP39_013326 [Pinctada imbricata]|uniref:C2H2-type domain-containing protein n=1 Tax=Pinctada imbricata TaxID=66713 RepID=A0AA88YEW4_PINIB|nr:hypothetical protein FSP39_013326 [Pinctada imbricata]
MQVRFKKQKGDAIETTEPHFHGRCHILLKPEDIEHSLRESVMKMINSFIEYQREGSNWTLERVMNVNIHIATYIPIKGSSYLPLPAKLAKKKAIVNPQNNDHKCFMWSVLASPFPGRRNPQRIINYVDHTNDLDFSDIPFPVKVADIPKFEKRNGISINVFGYERGILFPLHLTKERGVRHANLLLLADGEKTHYCSIKNFNRLLGDQNHDNNQYHYCHYCLHGFTKKRLLKKHIPYCQVHGAQRTEMPCEENKWLQFEEVKKQLKVPYVVYAHFESILEQQYGCQPDPSKASTIKLARHIPSGFTYKVVGLNQELTEDHVTYRGPDTIKVFVDHMVNLEERLTKVMSNPKPLLMTNDDHKVFREATHCHICGKMLNHDRVRDHCHISGKFRGAAHNECNLKFQLTKRIPVFFYNLRGYDAHHIMSEIGKMKRKNLKCIPQNHEKYISFS